MFGRDIVLRLGFRKDEGARLDWHGNVRRLTAALLTYAAVAVVSALQKDLCFVSHFSAQTASGHLLRLISHRAATYPLSLRSRASSAGSINRSGRLLRPARSFSACRPTRSSGISRRASWLPGRRSSRRSSGLAEQGPSRCRECAFTWRHPGDRGSLPARSPSTARSCAPAIPGRDAATSTIRSPGSPTTEPITLRLVIALTAVATGVAINHPKSSQRRPVSKPGGGHRPAKRREWSWAGHRCPPIDASAGEGSPSRLVTCQRPGTDSAAFGGSIAWNTWIRRSAKYQRPPSLTNRSS
jgi:hypothetical protein